MVSVIVTEHVCPTCDKVEYLAAKRGGCSFCRGVDTGAKARLCKTCGKDISYHKHTATQCYDCRKSSGLVTLQRAAHRRYRKNQEVPCGNDSCGNTVQKNKSKTGLCRICAQRARRKREQGE